MTAWLFLAGAWAFGATVVRRALGRALTRVELALWGLVVGWFLAATAAYACARSLGRPERWALIALTAALWIAAGALSVPYLRRARDASQPSLWWAKESAGLLCVLALFVSVFWQLFSTHMLDEGPGGLYSGGSTWYDLGFHLALTNSFLHGQNYPPISPSFPPAPLHYPFLPDFLTASLVALGMSLRAALISTGVALSLAATGTLYSLARRVGYYREEGGSLSNFGRRAQASGALAAALFLLNGGFGFLYLLVDWRAGGRSLLDLLWHPPANYANLPEQQIRWTNIVADTLLPQRTSLFGIPAALMIFALFAVAWARWSDGEARADSWTGARLLFAAGCLAGLLPLFHMHSYAAVGLVSGFLFCLRPRRAWLAFWAPAVLLALPSFVSLSGHAAASGFMRLQPGWLGHATSGWWPLYWLLNVGPVLLLALPAWLATPPPWRRFYAAFVLLLIFSLLVVISPNDYDNIKLMFYWYAATCVLVADWLVRLASARRARPLARFAAALLVLASTASGLLALRHEARASALFLSTDALAAAEFVRGHTSPRSLFLTAPDFQQPAWALAGRPILRGEYLWHHGYPYQEREADVRRIYAGADDALELLRYYRVDYVYLSESERRMFRPDEEFFERHFPVFYRGTSVTIYDVRAHDSSANDGAARGDAPYPPREFAARVRKDPYQLLVEFPRAGFAVYRFYRVAYGRWPECEEFMADMEEVGRGVYVGAPGWEARLEENKRGLTEAWAAHPEFKAAHDAQDAAGFVDALYANARLEPDASERRSLVVALERGDETRAGALRRVAEDRRLYRREYNAAYILAHYFGYLRRNPDDPPDKNLDGFNFWLRELDGTGDRRSVSRIFMESEEYKDRVSRKQ